MNRTIDQWQKVDCEHVAKNASPAHVMYLLQDAVRDLQELARQRDELSVLMEEVIRISDRKHDAWDAAKVAIAKIKEQTK